MYSPIEDELMAMWEVLPDSLEHDLAMAQSGLGFVDFHELDSSPSTAATPSATPSTTSVVVVENCQPLAAELDDERFAYLQLELLVPVSTTVAFLASMISAKVDAVREMGLQHTIFFDLRSSLAVIVATIACLVCSCSRYYIGITSDPVNRWCNFGPSSHKHRFDEMCVLGLTTTLHTRYIERRVVSWSGFVPGDKVLGRCANKTGGGEKPSGDNGFMFVYCCFSD